MKVKDVMIKEVKTCRVGESVNTAAKLMWDHACGCAPVLDDSSKVAGIITDRDICMAAYTQGKPLQDIPVRSAMSKVVRYCAPQDTLIMAENIMKTNQVRRLPVLDDAGNLVGIISLDDIAREARCQREAMIRDVNEAEVGKTLAGICDKKPGEAAKARGTASLSGV
jgi:CBS domain-containing protein